MISVFACSALYALKGGQHARFANPVTEKAWKVSGVLGWITGRILDGRLLSSVGFGLLLGSPLCALAWYIAVTPSVGEQIGGVGGIKGNWGPEGRSWGWKNGLQRGVFTGALLALATGNTAVIVAGALFPVCYFAGVSLEQMRRGKVIAGWWIAEWIYGAVLGLGVAYG